MGEIMRRLRFKIAVSFFILFHWFCVLTWLMPKPSAIKTYFLTLKIPFVKPQKEIASTYLYHTAMWQDWAMFAPDPLQVNRYVGGTIYFKDGSHKDFTIPRLSQMNFLQAWVHKRYRKLSQRLIEDSNPVFRTGLARYMARHENHPDNPPTRVVLNQFDSPIPRHDRAEVRGPNAPKWINYTKLLRDDAKYNATVMIDYSVKEEDLK